MYSLIPPKINLQTTLQPRHTVSRVSAVQGHMFLIQYGCCLYFIQVVSKLCRCSLSATALLSSIIEISAFMLPVNWINRALDNV